MNDELWRRLAEIACGRTEPPLAYEEVMRRVREIACNGHSIEDTESTKQ